jgi:hypothetical protein
MQPYKLNENYTFKPKYIYSEFNKGEIMITFQEWLEEKDPETYNEFLSRFLQKKPSNARPFNPEERKKLAALQDKSEPQAVLSYKGDKPKPKVRGRFGDPSEIDWRG